MDNLKEIESVDELKFDENIECNMISENLNKIIENQEKLKYVEEKLVIIEQKLNANSIF